MEEMIQRQARRTRTARPKTTRPSSISRQETSCVREGMRLVRYRIPAEGPPFQGQTRKVGAASRFNGLTVGHPRGKDDHVRTVEEVAAGVVEHGAPAGDGREDAEAEEAQRASRVDRAVALRCE